MSAPEPAASLISTTAIALRDAAIARGETVPPIDDVLGVIMKYLPNLLGLLGERLVTEHEVAGAITDRFVVWLADQAGRRFSGTDTSWELVVDDVAAIIHRRTAG